MNTVGIWANLALEAFQTAKIAQSVAQCKDVQGNETRSAQISRRSAPEEAEDHTEYLGTQPGTGSV